MSKPLEGRAALITGASQGLGAAIAAAYIDAGASVMLCARDAVLLESVRVTLTQRAGDPARVRAMPADVADAAAVEALVQATISAYGQVHVLVNNAGVYGPLGRLEDVDWLAWVDAVRINLLGSVLPCRALIPHFRQHRYGKVVQLSGGGATGPLPRISAYAASKAAVVRFAETLAEELRGDGVDVNAIAPGALNTRLLDQVLAVGPGGVGSAFYDRSLKQKETGGASLDRGAALAVYLASAASDGLTGKLLSAVWDPWEELETHRADLDSTDVYTLRRIVPADRGLSWGQS